MRDVCYAFFYESSFDVLVSRRKCEETWWSFLTLRWKVVSLFLLNISHSGRKDDPPATDNSKAKAAPEIKSVANPGNEKNGYSIEELFYSFQREIRFQREQSEALRKEVLELKAQLAKEQGIS